MSQILPFAHKQRESYCNRQGLFRATLAGAGHTLADAFGTLEATQHLERSWRHPTRDLMGARVALEPHEGTGYWDFIRIRNDIYVVVANLAYHTWRLEIVPGEGLLSFSFKVSGDMSLEVNSGKSIRWNSPSLLVWSQPTGVNTNESTAPGAHERFVIVSMRPEYFAAQYFGSAAIPEALNMFLCSSGTKIQYARYPILPEAFEISQKLIGNPYTGALSLVYAEAMTGQLLCHVAGNFASLARSSVAECTDRQLRCLRAARDILEHQLAPAPTIADVARSVGMSKTALTKGFKAVYGETVFEFSVRCRMRRALELMGERRYSIEQIAEAAGYAHSTSFATAFRRHFGMRPVEARRGGHFCGSAGGDVSSTGAR